MLRWAEPCKGTKLSLGSRIPISQTKRNRSFRMNENRKLNSARNASPTRNVYDTSRALGIADSEKGTMSSKFELKGVTPQRNIETDVFDWLSKNSDTSDKYTEYCLDNNTNICTSTGDVHSATNSETAFENNKEDLGIAVERDLEMAKRGNEKETGTKSYFTAFKNAIFPFEGKYFYLSGELNNQKVSLTETTKIIGDNSGHLVDKTSCNDDKYKEILQDKRGENATKTTNKKWEINGLKDTKVYYDDQPMNTEDKNGYVRNHYGYNKDNMTSYKDNMTSLKINLKSDTYSESQQKEINRLRTQIEKLSAFVESTDERREQSDILLSQQKEELLKQIREKEVLENRVCCLEELRRNVQRKVDEISDENKSFKITLKLNKEKLTEEKERVQVLKKECSNEIAKNVELELVLQTIREELGCATPAKNKNSSDLSLGTRKGCDDLERDWDEGKVVVQGLDETEPNLHSKHGEKKVHWGNVQTQEIKKPPQSLPFNAEQQLWGPSTRIPKPEAETTRPTKTHYSCLKQHTSDEALWKREKKQFEGKIILLEMDKKKLRSQIDLLEAKIIKQESIGQNLRENNEVLEFRILELEYELLEKPKK